MYENNDPHYIQTDVDDLFHELSNIEFTVSNADSISIIIEDIEAIISETKPRKRPLTRPIKSGRSKRTSSQFIYRAGLLIKGLRVKLSWYPRLVRIALIVHLDICDTHSRNTTWSDRPFVAIQTSSGQVASLVLIPTQDTSNRTFPVRTATYAILVGSR